MRLDIAQMKLNDNLTNAYNSERSIVLFKLLFEHGNYNAYKTPEYIISA